MQARQLNRQQYFNEQSYTTKKYVIPFIETVKTINENDNILEIGCGDGGNMEPFLDLGCKVTGVDPAETRINDAKLFFINHPNNENLTLVIEDIYDWENKVLYDVIIVRDVLEHINNQERFLKFIKKFIKPDGIIFFGYPPWQNPFGGHQQICKSALLSKLPFFHLLPMPVYKFVLKSFGENQNAIDFLVETKEYGITIERFEKIIKTESYRTLKKVYYFINPNYEVKFNLKPRELYSVIGTIPIIRNFFTTTCYVIIGK